MTKVPVSIIIPVKNEVENLRRAIESVAWASEIFVIDSRSEDGTVELAESLGAKVVQFDFNGTWPKKKNWALENLPFANEWIFILDADEVLPKEAADEFSRIVTETESEFVGYWINRRFMFLGKWLRHAYFPNWNLRLFKHRLGRYEKITDQVTASGDNEVHEHVVVDGNVGRLKCLMDHYAFPSVEVFIEKHNRYSNWEARVACESMSAEAIQMETVSWRRRIKRWVRYLPFRPLMRFLYVYVWERGFLDGKEGYYFARLHATYELLSVIKTYEFKKQKARSLEHE